MVNKLAFEKEQRGSKSISDDISIYRNQIAVLEQENNQLKMRISQLQFEPTDRDIQIEKLKRIIDDLET